MLNLQATWSQEKQLPEVIRVDSKKDEIIDVLNFIVTFNKLSFILCILITWSKYLLVILVWN